MLPGCLLLGGSAWLMPAAAGSWIFAGFSMGFWILLISLQFQNEQLEQRQLLIDGALKLQEVRQRAVRDGIFPLRAVDEDPPP